VRSVSLGSAGAFAITSLPSGDYYVVAIGGIDTQLVTNPGLLEKLESRSIVVRLASEESRSLELVAVFP
jgi:hypothetical protein